MENKYIIPDERGSKVRDENRDTVKLKRHYMISTLSEAFEMFREQYPKQRLVGLLFAIVCLAILC